MILELESGEQLTQTPIEELQERLRKFDGKATVSGATDDDENEDIINVSYKGYTFSINLEGQSSEPISTIEYAYYNAGPVEFTGKQEDVINTGVCLYTTENVNKDFIMTYTIDSASNDNVDRNAIMSSMNEAASPWPGHNTKVAVSGSKKELKFESNSKNNSAGDVTIGNITDTPVDIVVMRTDHKLYFSKNGEEYIEVNDFTDTNNNYIHDTPVSFGGILKKKNGEYQPDSRYFKGTLSNMTIQFLNKQENNNNDDTPQKSFTVAYRHAGKYTFDGSSSTVINTGLQLFTQANMDKDFEMSFTVDSIDSANVEQATLVNMKDESQTNIWPGYCFRKSGNNLQSTAKGGSGLDKTYAISTIEGSSIKISRVDRIMYITINNGTPEQVYDFTTFNKYHSVPLTLGGSIEKYVGDVPQYFRCFKGTISDITVKVQSN